MRYIEYIYKGLIAETEQELLQLKLFQFEVGK